MTAPLKVGDKVRTGFWPKETRIVRTVISVKKHTCEGGYLVEADGGESCKHCGYGGQATPPLSINWFKKVEVARAE